MDKSLYHPYINEDSKCVSGSAALNHYIFTKKNGLQNYHDEIGEEYIKAFVNAHSDSIHDDLAAKTKRKHIKIIA